jgi:hypothetical protein
MNREEQPQRRADQWITRVTAIGGLLVGFAGLYFAKAQADAAGGEAIQAEFEKVNENLRAVEGKQGDWSKDVTDARRRVNALCSELDLVKSRLQVLEGLARNPGRPPELQSFEKSYSQLLQGYAQYQSQPKPEARKDLLTGLGALQEQSRRITGLSESDKKAVADLLKNAGVRLQQPETGPEPIKLSLGEPVMLQAASQPWYEVLWQTIKVHPFITGVVVILLLGAVFGGWK